MPNRNERRPCSGPWTPAPPDRVGYYRITRHRIHRWEHQSELAQAGRRASRKIEARQVIFSQFRAQFFVHGTLQSRITVKTAG